MGHDDLSLQVKNRLRPCRLINLGIEPYQTAWNLQRSLVAERKANSNSPDLPDVLILLEHPPVYTLGQGSTTNFLKFDPAQVDYELVRIERGGEVTYHCPGQLMGYPILNLTYHKKICIGICVNWKRC